MTAVKLALAYAFIDVIGSEFIMARGGMGYEISFAYANFDNATMFAHPADSAAIDCHQRRALALGEDVTRQKRAELMQGQASATFRNTAILIVGLLLVWEIAYIVIGEVALRSPGQTIQFLYKLMQPGLSGSIWPIH